jgi:hypothetical protein
MWLRPRSAVLLPSPRRRGPVPARLPWPFRRLRGAAACGPRRHSSRNWGPGVLIRRRPLAVYRVIGDAELLGHDEPETPRDEPVVRANSDRAIDATLTQLTHLQPTRFVLRGALAVGAVAALLLLALVTASPFVAGPTLPQPARTRPTRLQPIAVRVVRRTAPASAVSRSTVRAFAASYANRRSSAVVLPAVQSAGAEFGFER